LKALKEAVRQREIDKMNKKRAFFKDHLKTEPSPDQAQIEEEMRQTAQRNIAMNPFLRR